MSSKFPLLVLSLIASAAYSTHSSAAPHGGAPVPKASMMKADLERVADAKTQKAPDARKQTTASSEAVAREKRKQAQAKAAAKAKAQAHARAKAKQKAAMAAKAKAAAKRQAALKSKGSNQPSPRRERYVSERERALDVAAHYAPRAIARLRRNRTIERAETSRASENAGWRRYVD